MADETTASSLPPEMLELIFCKLDRECLPPVALVSKSFLSSVRSLVYELRFSEYIPDTRDLCTMFDRFPSVKEIILARQPTDHVLLAISNSKLNLRTLRLFDCPKSCDVLTLPTSSRITSTLRCLQISWLFIIDRDELSSFNSEQIIRFIQQFPSLTELELSFSRCWDDRFIQRIASNLRNLRKLNLSGGEYLTDHTLAAISSNCVDLEHLNVRSCNNMTPGGIGALIHSCKHLHSLDLLDFLTGTQTEASIQRDCANPKLVELMETISSCKNLKHVSFGSAFRAVDVILRTFAKSRPPLSTLTICWDSHATGDANFTMAGVSELIRACRGRLVQLHVELPRSDQLGTHDREMSLLVAQLPHLECVRIFGSASSLHETLESLKSNCPLVETALLYWTVDGGMIQLDMIRQGENDYSITQTYTDSSWVWA